MTWSHPRGYDPMVACSALWKQRTGVTVEWDKRSLQDFESYPVQDLAARYDLIVIDHPHVGQITAENCLLPLDRAADGEALARGSVGRSYPSYFWQERQWALPIDAATQVQAWRSDLLAAPARTWAEVLTLAEEGRVLCPLRQSAFPDGLLYARRQPRDTLRGDRAGRPDRPARTAPSCSA